MKTQCQSCGMPLEKDPQGGGTNADGTKTQEYCSRCYQNGMFICEPKSAHEMQILVRGKLKEMGYGPITRWFFTLNIPRLRRWKGG